MPMKRKLSLPGQIEKLKEAGIQFQRISEEDALRFLQNNTYLFKIKSYAKNYPRSWKTGTYQEVDFAYLIELSTLDTHFRNKVLNLCLSIEHQLKVMLMRDLTENNLEDGYTIIQELFEKYPSIKTELCSRKVCESRALTDKYFPDIPVWVFLEACTFGSFIRLLNFYYEKYPQPGSAAMLRLTYSVRFLRNAAAHNNCLLNSLKDPYQRERPFRPNRQLQAFLLQQGFSKASLSKKLSNPLAHDFAAALKLFHDTCTSKGMYEGVLHDFQDLFSVRFQKHADYFTGYPLLTSYYEFAVKLLAVFSDFE